MTPPPPGDRNPFRDPPLPPGGRNPPPPGDRNPYRDPPPPPAERNPFRDALAANPYAAPAANANANANPDTYLAPVEFPVANPMRRILAAVLDQVYLGGVTFIAAAIAGSIMNAVSGPDPKHFNFVTALPMLLFMALVWGYIAWNWGVRTLTHGATLGKLSIGIRVHRADGSVVGNQAWLRVGPDLAASAVMCFCFYLILAMMTEHENDPNPPPLALLAVFTWLGLGLLKAVWLLVDFIMMLADQRHRSLNDKVAGTIVIEAGRT